MSIETLLQRLDKVKRTGTDKWKACCPAHDDKSPSLALRELDDGRVLLHCFSGCDIREILGALGLESDALYPEKSTSHHYPKVRKPWNASDVLSALAYEVLMAWTFAKRMSNGEPLNEADQARLLVCASRLQRGLEATNA